jgi:hypothetical protein
MNSKLLKLLVVVFFFSWTFAGICNFAYAIDNLEESSPQNQPSQTPKPEEKFQKAIEDVGTTLEDPSIDITSKKAKIKAKREEIEVLDGEIRKQFAETEKKLKDAGLPQEILQRHYKFIKHYEDNLNELKTNLDAIEKTKGLAVEVEIEKAKKHLQRVKPLKKHIPLDPNKLPHRTQKFERKEPRLKKEDFEKDYGKPGGRRQNSVVSKRNTESLIPQSAIRIPQSVKPILVASIGSLKGLLSPNSELNTPKLMVAQASNLPTPEDLVENIEVQFTPEIQAKAQELGNNPVKIYNWVRNNIEFVPTYGSIQGAHMTLLTKQGNAFDTASLLIALLRASNIPARYVYGTIELPIDRVMNWVGGFTDANAAFDFIASGGIPVAGIISGGKVTKARLEHIWVEAYLGYGPYSGRPSKHNPAKIWISLDPSFKQYNYIPGVDLQSVAPLDAQALIDQLKSTATVNEQEGYVTNVDPQLIQSALSNYQDQLQTYIQQNIPNPTFGKILGVKQIAQQDIAILPATLPYRVVLAGYKYSEIPETLRHKIIFEIFNEFLISTSQYTARIPELAGKRITLTYEPSTNHDQEVINSYGGIYNTPAYLVNVKPVIKVDGVLKATGDSIGLGRSQTFDMLFMSPSAGNEVVSNVIPAGGHHSIVLDVSSTLATSAIIQRIDHLKQIIAMGTQFFDDSVVGEILNLNGLMYFSQLNLLNLLNARLSKIVDLRHPSEATVSFAISVTYSWGLPFSLKVAGLGIDLDRDIHSVSSLNGDQSKKILYTFASGMRSSGLENVIFEQTYELESISAMKALQLANGQEIPIYTVNPSNLSQVLPQLVLSNEVKEDIVNAVNAGKVVTVPQRNLQLKRWSGVGYIIIDPSTGAGAYMISGGLAGGIVTGDFLNCLTELAQLVAAITTFSVWVEIAGYIAAVIDALRNPNSDMIFPLLVLATISFGMGILFFLGPGGLLAAIVTAMVSLTILWAMNAAATGNPSPITLIDDCLALLRKLSSIIHFNQLRVRYA